jgi:drug/metabolite transporter (DMT)-like permease
MNEWIIKAVRGQTKQAWRPLLSLLTGSLVWGLIWYPYRALSAQGLSGATATFLTYFLALGIGIALFRNQWMPLRAQPRMALAIGLSAGCCNLAYVLAMLSGEVMQVMLLFYLAPLWTVLFALLLLGEAPGWAGLLVIALSASGAAVMLWQPDTALPIPRNAAEWLGLSAGVTFALCNVLSRKAYNLDLRAKSLAIWSGVSLVAVIAIGFKGPDLAWSSIPASSWTLVACLGVVIFAVNLLVQEGVTQVGANQAIVLLLTELVFAAIGAHFLADERMSLHQWLGGALIVTATLLSGQLSVAKNSDGR